RLRETWGVVEQQVTGKTWVLGDRFSAADVYLFMLTTWLKSEKNHPQLGEFPNVKRIAEVAEQRSSIAKVYLT
ncbi:MAG: glutathione S-transferase family protein, partial [Pseudomonadota bacterium]